MDKTQQRIKIAEACGYSLTEDKKWFLECEDMYAPIKELPDYLNDLNAMHSAEKLLTVPRWNKYRKSLSVMFTDHPDDGYIFAINATAEQRAEAFLRTLGLWEEGDE